MFLSTESGDPSARSKGFMTLVSSRRYTSSYLGQGFPGRKPLWEGSRPDQKRGGRGGKLSTAGFTSLPRSALFVDALYEQKE